MFFFWGGEKHATPDRCCTPPIHPHPPFQVANPSSQLRSQRSFVLTAVEAASVAAATKDADGLVGNTATSDFTLEIR